MCLHTVSSILDEQYNWLLSAAGQWCDKFGRGPVFFCLSGCFVGLIMQCFKKQPC